MCVCVAFWTEAIAELQVGGVGVEDIVQDFTVVSLSLPPLAELI